MSKKVILTFSLVLFFVTGFAFLYRDDEEIKKPENKFTIKKIMGKEFDSAGISFFKPKFVVSTDELVRNYFFRDNTPKMFSDGVFSPQIIYVDDMGNIFITDAMNEVRVFNSGGEMIKQIDFPQQYQFSKLVADSDSEIDIFVMGQQKIGAYIISRYFDVKYIDSISGEYEYKFSKMKEPKVLLNKIGFAGGMRTLLDSGYGKYFSPGHIILYRFKEDFKGYNIFSREVVSQYQKEIPSEFITDKIDIEKLSDAKFVFINSNSFYYHKSDNIYLWGLSSDEVSRDTANWFKQIKISNPKYNVWKVNCSN